LEPGEHCIRERRFPPKVISAAKSFGPTIPDDENQEAFGRTKKATNQKQEADLFSGLSPPMEKTQHDYYWR
jgi:hypothetical protein